MSHGDDYTFVCPACGESMAVNAAMRDALVANGCVICGSTVTLEDFTGTTDVEV